MAKQPKLCRLCFSLTPAESIINIFDETGKMLNVASIISQHFWFRPEKDDKHLPDICNTCWTHIEQFHDFYLKIKIIQDNCLKAGTNSNGMPFPASGEFIVTIISDMDDSNKQQNSVMYVEATAEQPTKTVALPIIDTNENEDDGVDIVENSIEISDDDNDGSYNSSIDSQSQKRKRKRTKHKTTKDEMHADNIIEMDDQTNVEVVEEYLVEESNPLECIFCKIEFDTKIDLKQHYWIEHELEDASAVSAGGSGGGEATATAVTTTKSVEMNKPLKRSRIDVIRELFDLSCELCTAQPFQNHNILKEHYDKVHQMRRMYIVCRMCNVKIKTAPPAINEHIRWHSEPDFLRCQICDKRMKTSMNFSLHMKQFHGQDYDCPKCGELFSTTEKLTQHYKETKHNSKSS